MERERPGAFPAGTVIWPAKVGWAAAQGINSSCQIIAVRARLCRDTAWPPNIGDPGCTACTHFVKHESLCIEVFRWRRGGRDWWPGRVLAVQKVVNLFFLRPKSKRKLRPGVWGSQILYLDTIALLLVMTFSPLHPRRDYCLCCPELFAGPTASLPCDATLPSGRLS